MADLEEDRSTFLTCLFKQNKENKMKGTQYRETYLLNKVQNILVVNKLDITPINFFFSVLILLHLEYMLKTEQRSKWEEIMSRKLAKSLKMSHLYYLIEMLLKLFICKIDAKLFKTAEYKQVLALIFIFRH